MRRDGNGTWDMGAGSEPLQETAGHLHGVVFLRKDEADERHQQPCQFNSLLKGRGDG